MSVFKKAVINILKKKISLDESKIEELIEIPPDSKLGNFAFPCFQLAKEFKKSPNQIAEDLSKDLLTTTEINNIEANGPYINFFIDPTSLAKLTLTEIKEKQQQYGNQKQTNKLVMVEYSGPNSNKPLHIGHIRNNTLGMAISNILTKTGDKILKTNLVNDRGIHICKSMLGYTLFGNNEQPDIKSDHFVGKYYRMFEQKAKEQPELMDQAQELLKKWEANDKETRDLWKQMNNWAIQGMKQTYELTNTLFDEWLFESDLFGKAQPIMEDGLKKRSFPKRRHRSNHRNLRTRTP